MRLLENKDRFIEISYQVENEFLSVDRRYSGEVHFAETFGGIDRVKIPIEDNSLEMETIVDQSIVEVFVQKGRYALTQRVFPREWAYLLSFFSVGGGLYIQNLQIMGFNNALRKEGEKV